MAWVLPATIAKAAPHVPDRDDVVVATLPANVRDAGSPELRALKSALAKKPDDVVLATRLARHYVELGRASGDPRFAGYAQAALSPWWSKADAPEAVLILRAVLAQRLHRFDAALLDLGRVLERNPRSAQALLTRATVYQVQGRFPEAGADCDRLHALVPMPYVAACATAVAAATGQLGSAYDALLAVRRDVSPTDTDTAAWLDGLLAEMAERGGRVREAERHYRQALEADPDDQYLLAAYSDFLLDRDRPREVLDLLRERRAADPLLLRYALAATRTADPDAASAIRQLRDRFEASRRRGDRVHLREEARFVLALARDPVRALPLARENWSVQKEPADAIVLLEAATRAGDAEAIEDVRRFMAATRLEDVRLAGMLRGAPNPVGGNLRTPK
jgi:tetratricopeptide (TPR) repeat protein